MLGLKSSMGSDLAVKVSDEPRISKVMLAPVRAPASTPILSCCTRQERHELQTKLTQRTGLA
jgi:hypothetical protein